MSPFLHLFNVSGHHILYFALASAGLVEDMDSVLFFLIEVSRRKNHKDIDLSIKVKAKLQKL